MGEKKKKKTLNFIELLKVNRNIITTVGKSFSSEKPISGNVLWYFILQIEFMVHIFLIGYLGCLHVKFVLKV